VGKSKSKLYSNQEDCSWQAKHYGIALVELWAKHLGRNEKKCELNEHGMSCEKESLLINHQISSHLPNSILRETTHERRNKKEKKIERTFYLKFLFFSRHFFIPPCNCVTPWQKKKRITKLTTRLTSYLVRCLPTTTFVSSPLTLWKKW
jgi:hypothetical protein